MSSSRDKQRVASGSREHPRKPSPQPATQSVPQHEELIKFICDSWTKVIQEYNHQRNNPQAPQTVHYHSDSDGNNSNLKDFVPFDLESWNDSRVRRLVHNAEKKKMTNPSNYYSSILP